MAYIGSAPTTTASRKSQTTYRYLCTAGQTVFSGADLNNNTLSCDPLDTEIFMNGLKLDSTDTTITTTQVTLAVAAAAGDELEVVAYRTFESADHYTKSAADARYYTQTDADTRYVNASGDTFTGLVNITNTYSSDTTEQLRVSDNTGSKLDFFGHANGTKSIQAYADDGSTFYNLNLQPLGGHVTMPNQPAFSQAGYKSHTITTTTSVVMSSSNVWSANVSHAYASTNSGWDVSTGLFTAPVAGRYCFTLSYQLSNHGSGYFYTYIQQNGVTKTYQYSPQSTLEVPIAQNAILNMAVNDTARVVFLTNYASGIIKLPSFSGHLIG